MNDSSTGPLPPRGGSVAAATLVTAAALRARSARAGAQRRVPPPDRHRRRSVPAKRGKRLAKYRRRHDVQRLSLRGHRRATELLQMM